MAKQKPNKNPEPAETLVSHVQSFGDKAMRKLFGLGANWQKRRDIVKNNYDLGTVHLARGNVSDAVLRFRLVTWLEPTHADAWYNLGRSYLADGKSALAKKALTKALQLKPDNEEAHYLLSLASGKAMKADDLPRRIPLSLAVAHFEGLAHDYTQEQLETYQYSGHTQLCTAILNALGQGRVNYNILDLGVGTGLCGPLLRNVAAEIAGVDFSNAMLSEAMKLQDGNGKKIYDALFKREIQDFMREAPDTSYDIILAASTLSYIGDLQALFQQVWRVLKTGGVFAFTVDKLDGEDFQLDTQAARFRYSATYLQGLAERNALGQVRFDEAEVYPGYKVWLCVFGK